LSNLDAILAAAKAQSTALTPVAGAAAPLPALAPTGGSAVAYNMSADAFLNPGGMECDSYIQVKDAGIKLNKDWGGYIDEFDAILDMRDVQFFMGIRKEVGSTVTYVKSYDGVTTSRGENFAQVVEEFKRTSQKPADTYRGADIPLTLVADVAPPKGKSGATYTAGQVVGLTTSITGFKPFAAFARKLQSAGLMNQQLKVKVKHSARKNAANQDYGVCEFDVIEVLGAADAEAA
jgi:hypothetical protein